MHSPAHEDHVHHDHVHHDYVEQPFVDNGPSDGPPEALMLDIGDDVGALILYAEEQCLGQEIDITPIGQERSHHIHTMIRRRRAAGREYIAGVIPAVTEGIYTVWGLDGAALGVAVIAGGEVTEYDAADCHRRVG